MGRALEHIVIAAKTFVIAAIIMISSSANVSADPSPTSSSGQELNKHIEGAPPRERTILRSVVSEIYPMFVFIPGILGSELTKETADGTKIIWGRTDLKNMLISGAQEALEYTDHDVVTAKPLNAFFVERWKKNIYGKAIATIEYESVAAGAKYLIFSYDWRQSNQASARLLNEKLCAEASGRPIVFLAHSMGGLVLKHWLKFFYEDGTCPSGQLVRSVLGPVDRLVFIGTPHFGAPAAIRALADRYYVMVDPDDKLVRWTGYFDSLISKSLNIYGGTFPSLYELLPSPRECLPSPELISAEIQNGNNTSPIDDLFSDNIWNTFHWPKNLFLNDPTKLSKFRSTLLPKYLKEAKGFKCKLSMPGFEQRFEVDYVYSKSLATTCKVTIQTPDNPDDTPAIRVSFCPGDGTVPMYAATSGREGILVDGDHLNLLSTDQFNAYVHELFTRMRNLINLRYKQQSETGAGPVVLDQVTPPILNQKTPEEVRAAQATIETNRLVEDKVASQKSDADLFAKSVYRASRHKAGRVLDLSRVDGYRAVASLSGLNARSKIWALNNAADVSLKNRNYEFSFALAQMALEAAAGNGQGMTKQELRKAKGQSAWAAAKSAWNLGKVPAARQYQKLAREYGNRWAFKVTY